MKLPWETTGGSGPLPSSEQALCGLLHEHPDAVSSHAGPGAAMSGLRIMFRLVLELEGVCVSPFA